MKLSLAWIFDHIESDWRSHDIETIVAKFNQITAEIEQYNTVSYDLSFCFLGWIEHVSSESITLHVPALDKSFVLPMRLDAKDLTANQKKTHAFMIVQEDDSTVRWATCLDFQLDKIGDISPLYATKEQATSWKDQFEVDDIILEVDNKSITHRPDMWGHRGFAREIAAFMGLKLKDKSCFLAELDQENYENQIDSSTDSPFTIYNKASDRCLRFSGLYCSSVTMQPSSLHMASRLMKVGSRSINAVVDITNYVMLDWSQPMHAFDAARITDSAITIRVAQNKEKLLLLDDTTIDLTAEDLVIAQSSGPMALAGVMGGKGDSISSMTNALYLESAHFTPTGVRKSAARHKIRTEASARFEKKLDPNQTVDAIKRFVMLAKGSYLELNHASVITSVGKEFEASTITIDKSWLGQRAGFELTSENVIDVLSKIGFLVSESGENYIIKVPSFRGAKDVVGPEDILEEIVRFYGFDKIESCLPAFVTSAKSFVILSRRRLIKNILSHAAGMTEQVNYPLFDEKLLKQLEWQPASDALAVINPVSSNQIRLVTSLIPHLLKNVADNYARSDQLSFYEIANQWDISSKKEEQYVSGVFFHKRGNVDFYQAKAHLETLFHALKLSVVWQKAVDVVSPWYATYQTAKIMQGDVFIGYAGMIDPLFLAKLDVLDESNAFAFELSLDKLVAVTDEVKHYMPTSKYQENNFDVSFMVPRSLTVASMQSAIERLDTRIIEVKLFDFFEKKNWSDQRAVAFHIVLSDVQRMLEKQEVDALRMQTIAAVESLGGVLRV